MLPHTIYIALALAYNLEFYKHYFSVDFVHLYWYIFLSKCIFKSSGSFGLGRLQLKFTCYVFDLWKLHHRIMDF